MEKKKISLMIVFLCTAGLLICGCEADSGDSGGSGGGATVSDACLKVSNNMGDRYVTEIYIKSYINKDDPGTWGTDWLLDAGYNSLDPGYYIEITFNPGTYDILLYWCDINGENWMYVFEDNVLFDSDEFNTIYLYKSGGSYMYAYYLYDY